jgi:hypothetical protein
MIVVGGVVVGAVGGQVPLSRVQVEFNAGRDFLMGRSFPRRIFPRRIAIASRACIVVCARRRLNGQSLLRQRRRARLCDADAEKVKDTSNRRHLLGVQVGQGACDEQSRIAVAVHPVMLPQALRRGVRSTRPGLASSFSMSLSIYPA